MKQLQTSSDEGATGGNPRTGGRGMYCCIPDCGSCQYDRNINKTYIALFSFPNKEKKPAVYKSLMKYTSLGEKVGKMNLQ